MMRSATNTTCLTLSALAALGLALAAASSAAADLNDGLVGYWSFDEGEGGTAYDYSGHGNHGTIQGASWTSGISGSALDFHGWDDYAKVLDSASLRFDDTRAFTLVAWVQRRDYFGRQVEYVVNKGIDSIHEEGYALIPGARVKFAVGDGTNRYYVSGYSIGFDDWHHVAGVWDHGTMRLYIDGVDEASADVSITIAYTSTSLYIGNNYWEDHGFRGLIDEVRIYERALSEDEVLDLYWNVFPDPQEDTAEGDQSDVSGTSSDPVNTATGSFFHQETDLSIPSRGSPLTLTRYYNSKAAAPERKTATSQPASTKNGERSGVGAKKHDESPAGKDQEQPAGSSQPRPKMKESAK
ncbi:MAG: LamG domain-containing protein [Phycisphaerae bacterium]|nr:LamG domain-containing protein [Phycisphaerae bacterium]